MLNINMFIMFICLLLVDILICLLPRLLPIIMIHVTYGDTKILSNIKMSQNIMTRIVGEEKSLRKVAKSLCTILRTPDKVVKSVELIEKTLEVTILM